MKISSQEKTIVEIIKQEILKEEKEKILETISMIPGDQREIVYQRSQVLLRDHMNNELKCNILKKISKFPYDCQEEVIKKTLDWIIDTTEKTLKSIKEIEEDKESSEGKEKILINRCQSNVSNKILEVISIFLFELRNKSEPSAIPLSEEETKKRDDERKVVIEDLLSINGNLGLPEDFIAKN